MLGLESVYEEWVWLQLSILGEITAMTRFCMSTGVSVIGPGKMVLDYVSFSVVRDDDRDVTGKARELVGIIQRRNVTNQMER